MDLGQVDSGDVNCVPTSTHLSYRETSEPPPEGLGVPRRSREQVVSCRTYQTSHLRPTPPTSDQSQRIDKVCISEGESRCSPKTFAQPRQ
jgi:hypothetical protein